MPAAGENLPGRRMGPFTEGERAHSSYIHSMKKILFVISALLTSQLAISQQSGRKILHFINDSGSVRWVIPDSIFSCHADGLAAVLEMGDGKHHYGYDIRWDAREIDGSYVLSVTEKQLYLHTSHDNPNPDYLYWFTNIHPDQYKLISNVIKHNRPVFGKPCASKLVYFIVAYTQAIPDSAYSSLQNLIALFNKALPAGKQISFPTKEDFDKTDPVQMIFNEAEIREEVPEDSVNTPA